jgi:nucleoside-diphosphate-sugar epimerase
MIIGNGMIANSFKPYKGDTKILIFASGVSDSKNIDKNNFSREELLLTRHIKENPEKVLVYFSTCSIYDPSVNMSSYVEHKRKMEVIIKRECSKFYIFRLPQVVGITSSPTLVNFLFTSILRNEKIKIYKNSTRNLIGIYDVFFIVDYLIKNELYINEVTNIATPNNVTIIEIVKNIEEITGLILNYKVVESGCSFDISIDKIRNLDAGFNIFTSSYLQKVLHGHWVGLSSKSF